MVAYWISRFSDLEITLEYCYPTPTPRKGALFLYSHIFTPVVRRIPRPIMNKFGWHVVVRAKK